MGQKLTRTDFDSATQAVEVALVCRPRICGSAPRRRETPARKLKERLRAPASARLYRARRFKRACTRTSRSPLQAKTQSGVNRLAHRAAKAIALFQLQRNRFRNQRGIDSGRELPQCLCALFALVRSKLPA